ncbi:unnamed protein product, partial [Ectocarpus sp. 12 AP-2014]
MAHPRKLLEDLQGTMFEYLHQDEAVFLYEEVFVRRSYFQHGIRVKEGAVVVDAGANIGLFSLQCLREAKGVQIIAFEPIPVIYDVLVRNLFNASSGSVKEGTCPKPVALRVALGPEQAEEEFYFFRDNPGESTRHRGERVEQRQALDADVDAASWRRVVEEGKHPGGEDVAGAHNGVCENKPEGEGGEPSVCSVVPLSLALHQLGLPGVDLLKVDVEGDELAVLHGIDDDDWPKIRQIALEVHDIDGRLAATIRTLTSEPAAFDEVCWQPLLTSEVKGYVMVVPEALKMFLVFAKRRPKKASSTDDGSAGGRGAEAPSVTGSVLECGEQAGVAHLPHIVGGSKGDSGACE